MEGKKTREFCDVLRDHNAMVFAIVGHKRQEPGWPDRYVCHRLWRGWLEFKDTTTKLEQKQAYVIGQLNERQPASAFVIRFPNSVEDYKGRLIIEFDNPMDLLRKLRRIRQLFASTWWNIATGTGCKVLQVVHGKIEIRLLNDDSISFWPFDTFFDAWKAI